MHPVPGKSGGRCPPASPPQCTEAQRPEYQANSPSLLVSDAAFTCIMHQNALKYADEKFKEIFCLLVRLNSFIYFYFFRFSRHVGVTLASMR